MRILHTMLRVFDLEKSLHFYTEIMGMRLLRKKDYPKGEFTLAFLGFADEAEQACLELTHNWGEHKYELGNAFGHLAVSVDDVHKAVEDIRAKGGKISREPGAMNAGTTQLAFIEDPDGYQIELLARK